MGEALRELLGWSKEQEWHSQVTAIPKADWGTVQENEDRARPRHM